MESKWITFHNENSEKMKIIRGKHLHPQTLSRKGYARYEYDWNTNNPGKRLCRTELFIHGHQQKKIKNVQMAAIMVELQKKLDEQPPNEGPIPIKFDVLSQVIGKEKSGHVRGMGAGVTPSRVGPENGEVGIYPSPQIGTSKSVQGSTLCVNDLCEVLDWEGTDLVVARGKISAIDPTTKVHGYSLRPNCYRVVVEEVVVPRAEFYRPQHEFSAMEDAVGSTIAWPTKYIVPL
ncbi:hypothetical protein ACLB2K_044815 [Fragaria x ananassa]